jgi:hypothetical protein
MNVRPVDAGPLWRITSSRDSDAPSTMVAGGQRGEHRPEPAGTLFAAVLRDDAREAPDVARPYGDAEHAQQQFESRRESQVRVSRRVVHACAAGAHGRSE